MDDKFVSILNSVNSDILNSNSEDLLEDGILDSLAIMGLISSLESSYDIDFDPDDIIPENFCTVDSIFKLLQKYIHG